MKKVNCAVYVRKSTERGLEQEFNSLNNQEDACKAYITSQAFNNWQYYKTYEDGGISGGTMKRPALHQMLLDIKQKKIQTIIVYKVDRLSRSIMDFHKMMLEFNKHNCNFVSITQSFDTSNSMGKLTLNMLLSFAQFEREVSSERVKDKLYNSKKKGLWVGGNPPLGYDVIDKKLVINPSEKEVVIHLYEKYLELQCMTKLREHTLYHQIKKKQWINQAGETRGGKNFSLKDISKLLKSQLYLGKIESKSTQESFKGQHEAIISQDLFNQVQEVLAKRSHRKSIYQQNSYLLSGKIYNTHGELFTNYRTTKPNKQQYKYYVCKGLYLRAPDIEAIVITILKNCLDSDLTHLLDKSQILELKSIHLKELHYAQQVELIKCIISKIVYQEEKLICYFNLKQLTNLSKFKQDNYFNSTSTPNKNSYLDQSQEFLIIEEEICMNHDFHNSKSGKIITSKAKNQILVKALAYAWRYQKLYDKGMSIDQIRIQEYKAQRTIYKYMSLNFLSPNIISSILEGNLPKHVDLQYLFKVAAEVDLIKQEKMFS